MRKISILLLFLMIMSQSKAQWVVQYGSYSEFDVDLTNSKGVSVTVDNWGNCYVTGYTNILGTGNDIFIVKYSPQGDTLWTRTYNGSENSDDQGNAIAVDIYGNVYVTGTAKFVSKSNEVILLKYNTYGTLQWIKTYGGTDYYYEDKGVSIALDILGNIYVTGYSTGTDLYNNMVTIKYDAFGDRKWIKTEDGSQDLDAQGTAIAVDNNLNTIVTGYCTDINGQKDMIVAKYNIWGNRVWCQVHNGHGLEDKAFGIVTDVDCNIYITGYTTISSGNTDYMTLKYNSSGSLLWEKAYNGGGNSEDKAFGIVVDNAENICITGFATVAENNKDYVTIKYSPEGNQLWAKNYNGTGNGDDKANAIGLLGDGNIVVTGASWGLNSNDDYATIKYDASSGAELMVSRYTMNGISEDVAKDVAVSTTSTQVYVTGYSELLINGPNASSEITTQMLPWGENQDLNTNNNEPKRFSLSQNYPNPFNPSTTIKFEVSSPADVQLTIYDMLGKVVDILISQKLDAGSYSIGYTNKGLSSGIYFYELKANSFRDVKKMTLIK